MSHQAARLVRPRGKICRRLSGALQSPLSVGSLIGRASLLAVYETRTLCRTVLYCT